MKYKVHENKISYTDKNENELARIIFTETKSGAYDISSTFVDDSLRGQGIAGKLVEMAVKEISRRGGEVTASCSYAKKWIDKNGIMPYVICHMVTSIDGKVTGDFLYTDKGIEVSERYYEINRKLKGDGFACGRITMESSFTDSFKPDLSEFENTDIACEDFIVQKHDYYAISFDRHGNVGWTDSKIHDVDLGYDNCHIIEVLSENTSKQMLSYYRKTGVSYIFAGKDDIDVSLALKKLYSLFGIKKLLLEGGSIINGAFQRDGLIDELSLVVAPLVADKDSKPLFDDASMEEYELISAEKMNDESVWMRYVKEHY